MPDFLAKISLKVVGMVVGGLIILGLIFLTLNQCQKKRSMAAQARVEHAQSDAAANSAADAVNTVSNAGEAQAASEALGRANDKDIRAAEGANQRVGTGVDVAGRAALCKRKAYANDPKCAPFRRHP